jgi:hypothetical protein
MTGAEMSGVDPELRGRMFITLHVDADTGPERWLDQPFVEIGYLAEPGITHYLPEDDARTREFVARLRDAFRAAEQPLESFGGVLRPTAATPAEFVARLPGRDDPG